MAACSHLHTPTLSVSRRPSRGVWVVGAHPSFFGVARMAETIVGRIIIRVVGRKKGMLSRLRALKGNKYMCKLATGRKQADVPSAREK